MFEPKGSLEERIDKLEEDSEKLQDYARRFREAAQEESAERIEDFDQLKLANVPWVDVRGYGAKGDGSTDDTVAIQAAFDTGVGRVVIPDGTYMINANTVGAGNSRKGIEVPSNIEIIMGANTVLQAIDMDNDDQYNIFVLDNVSNVVIHGNGATLIGDADNFASKPGSSFNGMGIRTEGATNVWIYDVTATKCWADGFFIGSNRTAPYNESVNVNLINCIATANYRTGLAVIAAIGGGVFGGSFDNTNGASTEDGIDIEPNADRGDGDPDIVRDFVVDGAVCRDNSGNGLEVQSSGVITDLILINNRCYSNTQSGMVIRDVIGVAMSDNVTHTNSGWGLSIYSSEDVSVNNHISHNNTADGILILNTIPVTTKNITINGGSVYENAIGLKITGDSGDGEILENITIKGLKCHNNVGRGMSISYMIGGLLSLNTITENGGTGLRMYDCDDVIVSNNNISTNSQDTDNTDNNIHIRDSDRVKITDNMIRHGGGANQAKYGIWVESGVDVELENNDVVNSGKTNNILHEGTFTRELTIINARITVDRKFHTVDGEGGEADNLDIINGGYDGMGLTLMLENVARVITVRDGQGNIELEGGANMALTNIRDKLYLFYDATASMWVERSRFTG